MKTSLFQSGVLLHCGRCGTRNTGFIRSFSVVLFLLPLLFTHTAYGDINAELLKAVEAGNAAKVEQLLKQGADANAKHEYGGSVLIIAAAMGHTETLKVLIEAGADVNAKTKYGRTALMDAEHRGRTGIVNILKQAGAQAGASSCRDINAELIEAAKAGNAAEVEQLLRKGADVNAARKDGTTALMATVQKGHTETVRILISAGVDVNAKRRGGYFALMDAAYNGHTETVTETAIDELVQSGNLVPDKRKNG